MEELSPKAMEIVKLVYYSSNDKSPADYLARKTTTNKQPKTLVQICKQAYENPDNLDWLKDEGYYTGRDFEQFKIGYKKSFDRQEAATKKLNEIAELLAL